MIEGNLEFWFSRHPVLPNLNVRVNPSHYGKRISVINELERELKDKITFKHEIHCEPEVHILGGRRVRGIVSVEMTIEPLIPIEEAVAELRAGGFCEGTEEILG
jgi:hypothetical protein